MSDDSTIEIPPSDPTPPIDAAPVDAPAEPVYSAAGPTGIAPSAAPTAEKNRTSLYVFAAVAAVVLAFGLSSVSFGAGVFVGRASGGRADFARSAPGNQNAQQWGQNGQQRMMPPSGGNGWSPDGRGEQDDSSGYGQGYGRGHGRGGYGTMPPGIQNAPTAPNGQ
jgi:hypothetical protein